MQFLFSIRFLTNSATKYYDLGLVSLVKYETTSCKLVSLLLYIKNSLLNIHANACRRRHTKYTYPTTHTTHQLCNMRYTIDLIQRINIKSPCMYRLFNINKDSLFVMYKIVGKHPRQYKAPDCLNRNLLKIYRKTLCTYLHTTYLLKILDTFINKQFVQESPSEFLRSTSHFLTFAGCPKQL